MTKKVFLVIGTRPEAIKMAPVHAALRADPDLEPVLISTGQHREMLDQALRWFDLVPDHDLELMRPNQTLSGVLAAAIEGLARLISEQRPFAVLAQGDTTTVFAAAVAAFNAETPFGHVEAGLRTRDLAHPFPEEGFRQMASRVARWNFCPTERAAAALEAELVAGERFVIGNTVVDALLDTMAKVGAPSTPLVRKKLVLITGHRRENHGVRFDGAFAAIARLAADHLDTDFVYPIHLNPKVRAPAIEHLNELENVRLIEPAPYPEMVALMNAACLILTDSGGVQEEAPSLGVPTLVLRDTTERPEAIECGACELVGVDPDRIYSRGAEILAAAPDRTARNRDRPGYNPYGDGRAAGRIAAIIAGREPEPYSAARTLTRP